ncbi:hypothetical protein [Streptomyces rubradiris]|uniref:hypothetical protein n=1 Tax=Streptomyces rubradiris TaxID=285531 RepID=UPI003F4D3BC9
MLLVLQEPNPVERAACVLREAFGYAYDDIAGVLRRSQAHTRQIRSRARKRLSAERREPVDAARHRRLAEAFAAAARHGDVTGQAEGLRAVGSQTHGTPPLRGGQFRFSQSA